MPVYTRIAASALASDTDLVLTMHYGVNISGTFVNDDAYVHVTPPTILTAVALEQKIADALVAAINTTYGTSFVRTDVVFLGGVSIPSL
jgi:hypothetical protein